eukprot:SAG31_NODE_19608_length_597_cov_0.791165_1_plen_55_part_01
MDSAETGTAAFYKHVADRKEAALHVLTGFSQPVKTGALKRSCNRNASQPHCRDRA